MPVRYTDNEIANMLQEPKPLPEDYLERFILRHKKGHSERELEIEGAQEHKFLLILRHATFNPLDFSIILAFLPEETTKLFRLVRYNGKSHQHTNSIEREAFYNFHIHMATERYQQFGTREDAYATPTDRFSDFNSALTCMVEDNGFILPPGIQRSFL